MSFAAQIEDGNGALSPVGSTLYGVCNTAASTAAKVVSLADFDTLLTGITIHVKFTNSNTVASPTLNVNSTGDIAIFAAGTTAPGTNVITSWAANGVVSFTYDGTYWRMNDTSANGTINSSLNTLTSNLSTEATTRYNGDIGVVRQIAPAYSTSSTYALGDLVTYNNTLYRCSTAITTAEAWTSGHWTAVTAANRIGKTFKFTSVSVATTAWSSNSTYSAQGYAFRASVALTGVTSSMVPEVVFGMADACSGNFAPIADTYNGGVYLYAALKPSATITIPVILCRLVN